MARYRKGLLWEVASMDGATSHIFGSMHVRDPRAFAWSDDLLLALSQKDGFFAELDLSSPDIRDFDPLMPVTERIHHYLSPARWKRMVKFLDRIYHFDLSGVDRIYPLIVLQEITKRQLSEQNPLILDEFLFRKAQSMNIAVCGLETWKQQGDLIRSIPVKDQANILADAVQHHRAFSRNLRSLISDYQRQEIHSLYLRTKRSLGGLRKLMLYSRNEIMAQRIFSELQNGGQYFFCIGAAHLAGKKGVLNKLSQLGCDVRRVMLT